MRALVGLLVLLVVFAPRAFAGDGAKMYKEFIATNQLYHDEAWQDYVDKIGNRLLAQTSHRDKDYTFVVIDSSQINAFATSDAYIFVNRGLIAFLSSEDELAAVIGHEIGHVVGKHVQRRKGTQRIGQGAGLLAAILTGRGELMEVSNAAVATMVSGYGREMELEADRYGGRFIAKAGYNPLAMISVVQVLKDQELFSKQVAHKPTNYHGLFASHPKNDKRLHDVVAFAQSSLPDEVVEPIADFWEMVDGLVYGDQAAAGVVKDSIFYHSGLRVVVEFPEGWSIASGQSQVTASAPGGSEVGVITVGQQAYQKKTTPEEYVTDVLQRDDVTNGESSEINGHDVYIGEIDTSNTENKLELIAILYRNKDVFLFKGKAGPDGDADAFRQQFVDTLHRLKNMTAADAQLANNHRIRVVTVDPGVKYRDLALNTPIRQYPEETLRLLNAGYPHGEPRPGDYIKVVQ
ncbi:MAG: M48 family metalloprotease [Gammaproteobacteria bacterium]|nr:M48 family metalloprotease [Gammaproteobacteria bacterium]